MFDTEGKTPDRCYAGAIGRLKLGGRLLLVTNPVTHNTQHPSITFNVPPVHAYLSFTPKSYTGLDEHDTNYQNPSEFGRVARPAEQPRSFPWRALPLLDRNHVFGNMEQRSYPH
jgi:hypothetical protein